MSRPWVLVVLLLLIVFTSQFEWKRQIGDEPEESSNALQKRQSIGKRRDREEVVKEKFSQNRLTDAEQNVGAAASETNDVGLTSNGQNELEDDDGLQEMVKRWPSRVRSNPRYLEQYDLNRTARRKK